MLRKRGSIKRRRFNNLGLIISSSYMILTLILKGITYHKFQNALEGQQIDYLSLQNKPSPFNTILWTANVETEDSFLIGDYSFFDSKPIQFYSHAKNHGALGNLKNEDKVQRLINIAEGQYTVTKQNGQLRFNDLRFGLLSVNPNTEKYAFSYILEKKEGELKVTEVPKDKSDAKKLLGDLWERIGGN
jgi:inner membrane protein